MKGYTVLANIKRIQRNRELNGERGFTLIELLIVIVVLGILAAVVVFALGGVTSQSAVAACNSDAKTVSTAVSAYQAQVGSAPASVAALVPTYLKAAPSNPAYTVSLSGGLVQIALASGDPGASPVGTYAPVGPLTAAEPYEGSTPYTFPAATTLSTSWPSSMAGQGICAGA
jgi:prepilin-type N-terminal cleavage/methylation domain-containing protein